MVGESLYQVQVSWASTRGQFQC